MGSSASQSECGDSVPLSSQVLYASVRLQAERSRHAFVFARVVCNPSTGDGGYPLVVDEVCSDSFAVCCVDWTGRCEQAVRMALPRSTRNSKRHRDVEGTQEGTVPFTDEECLRKSERFSTGDGLRAVGMEFGDPRSEKLRSEPHPVSTRTSAFCRGGWEGILCGTCPCTPIGPTRRANGGDSFPRECARSGWLRSNVRTRTLPWARASEHARSWFPSAPPPPKEMDTARKTVSCAA
eukprot:scaffold1211_cov295-Pavlova_lutheri.AAC.13